MTTPLPLAGIRVLDIGTLIAGPAIGAHNREILGELLGKTDAELADLKTAGVM